MVGGHWIWREPHHKLAFMLKRGKAFIRLFLFLEFCDKFRCKPLSSCSHESGDILFISSSTSPMSEFTSLAFVRSSGAA